MNPRVLHNQSVPSVSFNRTIPAITTTSELCKMAGVWSIKRAELIFFPSGSFKIWRQSPNFLLTIDSFSVCPVRLRNWLWNGCYFKFLRDEILAPLLIFLGKQMKTEYAAGSKMGTTEGGKKREGWCEVDVCSADWCEKNASYPKHTKGRRLEQSVHTLDSRATHTIKDVSRRVDRSSLSAVLVAQK